MSDNNNYKLTKHCEICDSDKATGRHFSVTTCESCKAFFRRNAFKGMWLNCPSNGKCVITVTTRKLCQKCRLIKCLNAGMKKEMVKTDEEREIKKKLLEEKRQKKIRREQQKQQQCYENIRSEERLITTDLTQSPTTTTTTITIKNTDYDNTDNDSLWELIDSSLNFNNDQLRDQIMEIENSITITTIVDNDSADTNNKLYDDYSLEKHSLVPVYSQLVDHQGLNQLEVNRMSELLNSLSVLDYPVFKDNIVRVTDLTEIIRLSGLRSELMVKDIVSFTKGLESFRTYCLDDQLSLIKHGFYDILMLRSLSCYDKDLHNFVLPVDDKKSMIISLVSFKKFNLDYLGNFMQLLMKLMNQFMPFWKHDKVIMDLMTAIVFFDPNRPNLKHRHNIKLDQQLYIYLLQRYLRLKWVSDSESGIRLCRLMTSMGLFHVLTDYQKQWAMGLSKNIVKRYGPLAREVIWPQC
ncbi:vitamin D3 receptor B-like [Oppia nitens]|uniref:vitamin D3 receptor B-like n=1 Tax=Oppia nitens TaxID=1686743 RepID=UPI0023DA5314|nr:vitamin D3 receptor B-like [Oppia nitens]